MEKKQVFEATLDNFKSVMKFVETCEEEFNLPFKASSAISLSVEEIYVNVARYAYKDKQGSVEITFGVENNQAYIQFVDSGIEFNPLEKNDPDINLSSEDRQIGGLGIFMVKKLMDNVEYNRIDGKNILLIKKSI